jgi:hypothetical protein
MPTEDISPAVARLASRLATILPDGHFTDGLCEAAREVLGSDGASLTMNLTRGTRVSISAIDSATARIDQLEDLLYEGPGRAAASTGDIHVATVGAHSLEQWPHLSDLAVHYGLTGTFWAVPMQPAQVVVGVLMLHRTDGWLAEDLPTVQLVANAIGAALVRDPSLVAPDQSITGSWAERSRIYRATGMITAQLNISPDDAAALLRAHAYAASRTLLEVAADVIGHRLDFTPHAGHGD